MSTPGDKIGHPIDPRYKEKTYQRVGLNEEEIDEVKEAFKLFDDRGRGAFIK
jgi:Ca2+-binding EF-hand superfamily protein